MPKRYSDVEDRFLRRHFSSKRPEWIAERLSAMGTPRDHRSVLRRAYRLGLPRVPRDYVRICDIGFGDPSATRNAALRDGVLWRPYDGSGAPAAVPSGWAATYVAERMERVMADTDAEFDGWLTARQVAAALGVSKTYVQNCVRPSAPPFLLTRLLKTVDVRRGSRGRLLFEPYRTKMVIKRFAARRVRRVKRDTLD